MVKVLTNKELQARRAEARRQEKRRARLLAEGPITRLPDEELVFELEGLWWATGRAPFSLDDKKPWRWTLMIRQPDGVRGGEVKEAIAKASAKGDRPGIARLRPEKLTEGPAAQILHIGPYSAEGPTIERLHGFIREQGGRPSGKHHEMYLSDPRRTTPEKLRTILRQPFKRR